MDSMEKRRQLEALRDFFFAESAGQMAAAYAALAETAALKLPSVDDWDAVEFAFNRLFIGPKAPLAPPFSSVYLEPEPQVMGKSTLIARQVFEMIGLQSPWQGTLPDDHLSLELDACLRFSEIRQAANSHEAEELWNYFLFDHLAKWLPLWIDRVRKADQVPEAIHAVINVLADWLAEETHDLKPVDVAIGR